jgi:hypothetical protein
MILDKRIKAEKLDWSIQNINTEEHSRSKIKDILEWMILENLK